MDSNIIDWQLNDIFVTKIESLSFQQNTLVADANEKVEKVSFEIKIEQWCPTRVLSIGIKGNGMGY